MNEPVFVIFDGPPSHESGRFVEVETEDRRSVRAGEWKERPDGYWTLGPFYLAPPTVQPADDALLREARGYVADAAAQGGLNHRHKHAYDLLLAIDAHLSRANRSKP